MTQNTPSDNPFSIDNLRKPKPSSRVNANFGASEQLEADLIALPDFIPDPHLHEGEPASYTWLRHVAHTMALVEDKKRRGEPDSYMTNAGAARYAASLDYMPNGDEWRQETVSVSREDMEQVIEYLSGGCITKKAQPNVHAFAQQLKAKYTGGSA